MRSFKSYYENKIRLAVKQLNIIGAVMEKAGFKVDHYLGEQFDDPYLYIYNPSKNTSFQGIRLYKIGDQIAYRIQRENITHPYGSAYSLDVELMFDDLMEEGETSPKDIGVKIMGMVVKEIRAFFDESADAEHGSGDEEQADTKDGLGMVHIRNPLGGDYSSMVHELDKR